jgi:hypothetical protein
MFGLRPRLPVVEEERLWVNEGFERLKRLLGEQRMLACDVIQPTDDYFPDKYDGSEAAVLTMLRRVCGYMKVDPENLALNIMADSSELMELGPAYSIRAGGPAGLHISEVGENKSVICVRQSLLKDPLTMVATIAHELGHVILLDGGLMSRDAEDMEPMTDLTTVFLGFGIFNANASLLFRKYRDERYEGWSTNRLGYLPQIVFGYALARFAWERGEINPSWVNHLSTNVRTYFQQSLRWLQKNSSQLI